MVQPSAAVSNQSRYPLHPVITLEAIEGASAWAVAAQLNQERVPVCFDYKDWKQAVVCAQALPARLTNLALESPKRLLDHQARDDLAKVAFSLVADLSRKPPLASELAAASVALAGRANDERPSFSFNTDGDVLCAGLAAQLGFPSGWSEDLSSLRAIATAQSAFAALYRCVQVGAASNSSVSLAALAAVIQRLVATFDIANLEPSSGILRAISHVYFQLGWSEEALQAVAPVLVLFTAADQAWNTDRGLAYRPSDRKSITNHPLARFPKATPCAPCVARRVVCTIGTTGRRCTCCFIRHLKCESPLKPRETDPKSSSTLGRGRTKRRRVLKNSADGSDSDSEHEPSSANCPVIRRKRARNEFQRQATLRIESPKGRTASTRSDNSTSNPDGSMIGDRGRGRETEELIARALRGFSDVVEDAHREAAAAFSQAVSRGVQEVIASLLDPRLHSAHD